jgi:hypothetical protein
MGILSRDEFILAVTIGYSTAMVLVGSNLLTLVEVVVSYSAENGAPLPSRESRTATATTMGAWLKLGTLPYYPRDI